MSCLSPYHLKEPEGVTVPCGKCPPCLKRRASGWSFRLAQEEKKSISSYFVTLTYDAEHLPLTDRRYGTLCIKDVQKFFKRLRWLHDKREAYRHKAIKYYVAGEYGGRYLRPHYHAIIFNANPFDIEAAWKLGYVHIGDATGASVSYTLKYMSKPGRIPLHANDDRVPERGLMSKGLGEAYLTPAMIRWHRADLVNRVYCNASGVKIAMPRYYRNKIYDSEDMAQVQVAMVERLQKKLEVEFWTLGKGDLEEYRRIKNARKYQAYAVMHKHSLLNRNKL